MRQVVRIFKNNEIFKDYVFVNLSDEVAVSSEEKGNVIACYNEQGILVGYNLKVTISELKEGYNKLTLQLMTTVNQMLSESGFDQLEADLQNHLFVGYVESCEDHPDSDHLHVCRVNVGNEVKTIVCGASNIAAHQRVVVALANAVLPDGKVIVPSSLRGVASEGMICSEWELKLIDEPKKGILVLDDSYEIGSAF